MIDTQELCDQIISRYGKNITHIQRMPPNPAHLTPFPRDVSPHLQYVFEQRSIKQLYVHQSEAYHHLELGDDIVVVTPTASGKTLCYNLKVLDHILHESSVQALYLFPTKALAYDQLSELGGLVSALDVDIKINTYDGDTPAGTRRAIREQSNIVITNPDMLHTGILPHHTRWHRFFENLQYLVVDEMHVYRGVFGSHFANLMRRFMRICRFYGSHPQVICCSATIANPKELGEALTGRRLTLIDRNGAPTGEKKFLFYNPPLINKELSIRKGALSQARRLATMALKADISTIVFARSRLNVEILTKYLRDAFSDKPGKEQAIRGYRGGYLPETRREIEAGLRDGSIRGVVSTNALELGIDIGALELVIMAGYPGNIASTWQRAGRAGRRQGSALIIMVAANTPLDQYMVQNPDFFFSATPEYGRVAPDNLIIQVAHLKCAAFELPFADGECFGATAPTELLDYLEQHHLLNHVGGKWHWTSDSYPASDVSLRNIGAENFVVVATNDQNKILAVVDFDSAPYMIHEGAIYLLESKQYHVDSLDWEQRRAYVSAVDVDYYTDAISYRNVTVLDTFAQGPRCSDVLPEHGEVTVLNHMVGFKKIKFYSVENVGYGAIALPDNQMQTTAAWWIFPIGLCHRTGYSKSDFLNGVMGISHALHIVAILKLMCDQHDLGRCVGDKASKWFIQTTMEGTSISTPYHKESGVAAVPVEQLEEFNPTIFLYDNYPGGIGFAELLFAGPQALLLAAYQLISTCACADGCPSCIGAQALQLQSYKKPAVAILATVLNPC